MAGSLIFAAFCIFGASYLDMYITEKLKGSGKSGPLAIIYLSASLILLILGLVFAFKQL